MTSHREIKLINKLGLHARAAAKLVQLTSQFKSKIIMTKNDQPVDAKSIMGVMMLAATCGTSVALEATGEDAEAALDAIEDMFNDRFGEDA